MARICLKFEIMELFSYTVNFADNRTDQGDRPVCLHVNIAKEASSATAQIDARLPPVTPATATTLLARPWTDSFGPFARISWIDQD